MLGHIWVLCQGLTSLGLIPASPGAVFGRGVSSCSALPSLRGSWAVGEQPRSPEVSRAGSHTSAPWGCCVSEGKEELHYPAPRGAILGLVPHIPHLASGN